MNALLVGITLAVEGLAVARVQTSEPVIALTFDACATSGQPNTFDRPVFEILKREHIAATVFVSGRWLESHPEAARELADEPLIEFGNHSYAHPHLSDLSTAQASRELDRTTALIEALGRRSVAIRPPFGDWNHRIARLAEEKRQPVVLWDVVSGDAGGHLSAARIVKAVVDKAQPGSIVIFHINGRGPHTKNALPEIIERLRARGLRFVTVSELLHVNDARLIPASPAQTRVRRKEPSAHTPG